MTESVVGGWYNYAFESGSYTPASHTGVVGLGFVVNGSVGPGKCNVTIAGCTDGIKFNVIDITENFRSPDPEITYRGGIQSIDKGFTAAPILIPLPIELPRGYEIGFVESATFSISGIWFDGLAYSSRDAILEDLRTTKKWVAAEHQQSPYIFLLSNRAYPVFITGYSSNIVGGQGNIISFRLGLSICQLTGHYGYT